MNNTPHEQSNPPLHRRVFSLANILSGGAAIVAFLIGATVWPSNRGIVLSAVVAGVVAGLVWWIAMRLVSGPSLESSLEDLTLLGSIPMDGSGPAAAIADTDALDRYTGLLREIEGRTTGRVLLVVSPSSGQGASTVALNMAIAATNAGRRSMLIDADSTSSGLSQYLSTGSSPGLSDIANGTSTLSQAARMWMVSDDAQFPMLPSGDGLHSANDLGGTLVAEAIETVAERADLVLIDVAPVELSTATTLLGTHADGSILVISDSADPEAVAATVLELEACGAPVLGYVRNRSDGAHRLAPVWWRRSLVHAVAAMVLLLGTFAAYTGLQLWYSWNQVDTETFDTFAIATDEPTTSELSEDDVELVADEIPPAPVPEVVAPTEAYETFLLIGKDKVSGAADVILFLVRPTNGAEPFMVSLPRDLYVTNACNGRNSRINALIRGCKSKDINGPSLLSYTVGQFTGIEVDHFAIFDFDGFEDVIDSVGGIEICVDYPTIDRKAKLSIAAGCTNASGALALAWVRSRHPQQKINGTWKSVPGAGDLARNQHQQDVILDLFSRLKSFGSPTELTAQVASVAGAFTFDDTLSLADAVSLAWGMRDLDLGDIKRLTIPVRLTRSKTDQSILVATAGFDEVLLEAYGGSLPVEGSEAGGFTPPSR